MDIVLIFFNMKVCCVFTLESPHRGDSNEYTQYTIFNMNKKNTLNYPKSAAMGFFPEGLKNQFETAVVNEPSVFEPLKFFCTMRSKPIVATWKRVEGSLSTNKTNFGLCLHGIRRIRRSLQIQRATRKQTD